LVLEALRAGACGYLLKEAVIDDIVRGIRAVAMGQFIASPRVARSLAAAAEDAAGRAERTRYATSALTERELGILRLIAAGKGNGDIGQELHISPSTVKHHVGDILEKLSVENRVQAAVYAVRNGLA
jgi:DNA-binding NarL/FixJ family response regulator